MLVGMKVTSEEWLAVATLLFSNNPKQWLQGLEDPVTTDPTFYFQCPRCKCTFGSMITPTLCPGCNVAARDLADAEAVTLTHKTFTGKTFPFSIRSECE